MTSDARYARAGIECLELYSFGSSLSVHGYFVGHLPEGHGRECCVQ